MCVGVYPSFKKSEFLMTNCIWLEFMMNINDLTLKLNLILNEFFSEFF